MTSSSFKHNKIISVILVISAILWVFIILRENAGKLTISMASLELKWIALSVVPAMISVFIATYIYYLVLSGIVLVPLSVRNIMTPFIVSQVVRYLPGKIWGIYYQIVSSKQVSSHQTVKANIRHFALTNLNSFAIAASVFTYRHEGNWTALVVFVAVQFSMFFFLTTYDSNRGIQIFTLLQAEWLVYFFTCFLILPGYYGIGEVLFIATCYVIAWIGGALIVMLPGGLFVREASFIWLSGLFGFNPGDMLAFSIIARMLFTLADVACASLSVLFLSLKSETEAV